MCQRYLPGGLTAGGALGTTEAQETNPAQFQKPEVCDNRSEVLHKTTITVAEKGTKAGAVTAVQMQATGAIVPGDYKTVILDRPFVYMLIDCESNVPFFIGTMEDPG